MTETAARNRDEAEEFEFHEFDEGSISALADLACGDDGPYPRKVWQLTKLLERSGWQAIPEFYGSRRSWLAEVLAARRHEPGEVARFVLRLGDPREYHGEPDEVHAAVVVKLNEVLRFEGYKLRLRAGLPVAVTAAQAEERDLADEVELHATITQLVHEPGKAALLERRLNEAKLCRAAGAHMAAVIMMGSALEGVLAEVAKQRGTTPNRMPRNLHQFIEYCHTEGWLQADAKRFTQELRQYRNLVHPDKDDEIGQFPDADTVTICWAVLSAALNDLDDTAQ